MKVFDLSRCVAGKCKLGAVGCTGAHNLAQLRVLTAIQQNVLNPMYKTERCSAFDDFNDCPRGETPLCSIILALFYPALGDLSAC